jgi:hypothetical protein
MCVKLPWFTITLRVGVGRERSRVMDEAVATRKTATYGTPTCGAYRELDLVAIPEPIPELGIEAGFLGTVDHVYNGGHKADIEVSNDDGLTLGYVTIEADPEPHVVGYYVEDA